MPAGWAYQARKERADAIDARAAEARKAFQAYMNTELQKAQCEHFNACDATLARWRERTHNGERDSPDASAEFDTESARLLAVANVRLNVLQRESETEHARIAQERDDALQTLDTVEPNREPSFKTKKLRAMKLIAST
jgi:hypothetical protein